MEQKYAEPLILCPPMQLNIIKMYKDNIIKNKYTFNDVKKLVPNVDLGFLNTKTIYKVKDR